MSSFFAIIKVEAHESLQRGESFMSGQFIIVHKKTGDVMSGKQGIYTSRESAKRALAYWVRKDNQSEYAIIHLDQTVLLTLI